MIIKNLYSNSPAKPRQLDWKSTTTTTTTGKKQAAEPSTPCKTTKMKSQIYPDVFYRNKIALEIYAPFRLSFVQSISSEYLERTKMECTNHNLQQGCRNQLHNYLEQTLWKIKPGLSHESFYIFMNIYLPLHHFNFSFFFHGKLYIQAETAIKISYWCKQLDQPIHKLVIAETNRTNPSQLCTCALFFFFDRMHLCT